MVRSSVEVARREQGTPRCEKIFTPFRLVIVFTAINLINYLDRGIIPVPHCTRLLCHATHPCTTATTTRAHPHSSRTLFNTHCTRQTQAPSLACCPVSFMLPHTRQWLEYSHNAPAFLQPGAYIIGYALSSLVFGHLVHIYKPFRLMAIGLGMWCVAIFICGIAPSYWVLFAGRLLRYNAVATVATSFAHALCVQWCW